MENRGNYIAKGHEIFLISFFAQTMTLVSLRETYFLPVQVQIFGDAQNSFPVCKFKSTMFWYATTKLSQCCFAPISVSKCAVYFLWAMRSVVGNGYGEKQPLWLMDVNILSESKSDLQVPHSQIFFHLLHSQNTSCPA